MMHTKKQIAGALALLDAAGSPGMAVKAPANIKEQAIQRCLSGKEAVKSVAEGIGYSESVIYKWMKILRRK